MYSFVCRIGGTPFFDQIRSFSDENVDDLVGLEKMMSIQQMWDHCFALMCFFPFVSDRMAF